MGPVARSSCEASHLPSSSRHSRFSIATPTGAWRWTAYIVPFLFAPALLLQSASATGSVIAIATALAGVWLISAGMIGYLLRPMPPWRRAGFIVSGAALLIPDQIAAWAAGTDLAGAVAGGALVAYELVMRRGRLAAATVNR